MIPIKVFLVSTVVLLHLVVGIKSNLNINLIENGTEIYKENATLKALILKCDEDESSLNDFPPDLFTDQQRKSGAIILHLFSVVYFFTLLAVVCNDYFLPSVECICTDLNISKDVAAATFMATATTTPEFFTNSVSTFITDSDIGVGTIIGSLLFNTLGVAAVAGFATTKAVELEFWPITRDCIIFSINIIVLIVFSWDGKIVLGESIAMVVMYVLYFVILFQNKRILRNLTVIFKKNAEDCVSYDLPTQISSSNDHNGSYEKNGIFNITVASANGKLRVDKDSEKQVTNERKFANDANKNNNWVIGFVHQQSTVSVATTTCSIEELTTGNVHKVRKSLWTLPQSHVVKKVYWAYTWPIKFLLTLTIPNPKTYRRLYPLTFIMCVVWIGVNAYMIVWMITIVGYTFGVPESIMGLTFLAAGGCMPEALSSVIMIRKGIKDIGVSNSLGSNSLSILFSLGMPWLIRNILHRNDEESSFISLSNGVQYTIMCVLSAIVALYVVLAISKYQLRKKVGLTLSIIYLLFITLCILLEMNILFPLNCV